MLILIALSVYTPLRHYNMHYGNLDIGLVWCGMAILIGSIIPPTNFIYWGLAMSLYGHLACIRRSVQREIAYCYICAMDRVPTQCSQCSVYRRWEIIASKKTWNLWKLRCTYTFRSAQVHPSLGLCRTYVAITSSQRKHPKRSPCQSHSYALLSASPNWFCIWSHCHLSH